MRVVCKTVEMGNGGYRAKLSSRGAHQQLFANKTSSYNAIIVNKVTNYTKLQDWKN